ncbi:MAG: DNA-3-methyladenine glycosylase [Terriglobia bacterium]
MEELALLCKGPARLTQAMAIQKAENGLDFCHSASSLKIANRPKDPNLRTLQLLRVSGWAQLLNHGFLPWRFYLKGNRFVS